MCVCPTEPKHVHINQGVDKPHMLQAMYAAVNSSICSSLRHTAGSLHDICRKAAATAVPVAQQSSGGIHPGSTGVPHIDAPLSRAGDERHNAQPLAQSRRTEGGSGAGVTAEQPQLGKSHRDSTASNAARAADEADDPEEAPYEPPRWLAGREKLTNKERRDAELQELSPQATPDGLTAGDVRHALASAAGFSLEVSKSGIEHPDSGDGVWLRGSADLGTVVAIHPGVVYSQAYHTCAPPPLPQHLIVICGQPDARA